MTPPFPRSYWAIPRKLLAGCYPGDLDPDRRDAKLGVLLASGVTLIVNLMEECESDHSWNPFEDYAARLHKLASSGEAIRTATGVGCYLVSQNIETAETVFAWLRELTAHASKFFWPTPQTAGQCDFITSWTRQ